MSPEKKPTQPIDIYCRVSKVGGRDVDAEGGSLEEQERRCRASLESKGLKAGEVFKDKDESGGDTSRPAFDRALARIEDGTSGGLCVLNLSRFGRRVGAAETVIGMERQGAAFISVQETFDTTGPMGRAMLRVVAAFAELELEQKTEQLAGSRDSALRRGIYPGVAPVGYHRLPEEHEDPDRRKRLVKGDPDDLERIANAYGVRVGGGSWSTVAQALAGVGGKQRWATQNARNLLYSPIYKGRLGTLSDGTPVDRPELAVVSHDTWERANVREEPTERVKAAKRTGAWSRGGRPDGGLALLGQGLLQCSGCGRALTHRSTVKAGRTYRYYRCSFGRGCTSPAIVPADIAERHLLAEAEDHFAGAGAPFHVGRETDPERIAELETAVEVARRDATAGLRALGIDPAAEVVDAAAPVRNALAALVDERDAERTEVTPAEVETIFRNATISERRKLIRTTLGPTRVTKGAGPFHDRIENAHEWPGREAGLPRPTSARK